MQLSALCSTPASLPRHQPPAAGTIGRDNHRLNDPARGDGCRKFSQRFFGELAARLTWVRHDIGYSQHREAVGRCPARSATL